MNRILKSALAMGALLILSATNGAGELKVPAYTAYLHPDPNGARVSESDGITRWKDPDIAVKWYGELKSAGTLGASVEVALPQNARLKLKLTVGGETRTANVKGAGEEAVVADFGQFQIRDAGYTTFTLESAAPAGKVLALVLEGAAVEGAHFNMKPRRNAASVHLAYPVERGTEVAAFHCEMTGVEDPLWTYYMACGWHRGYFGMQVNSPTERRIIFSVWDSGGEAIDRDKVGEVDRVKLMAKGEGVYTGDFGNEGTGGHSHLKYMWKTGEPHRFLVTAEPADETHTIFAGYFYHPEKREWMLISSWRAPKEGGYLRGLYSFSENFSGRNGHLLRRALYGNQWLCTAGGDWQEVCKATFSHDDTGKADRLDRFMGVTEGGEFFLSHGGFDEGFTKYGEPFERPASKLTSAGMKFPPVPTKGGR